MRSLSVSACVSAVLAAAAQGYAVPAAAQSYTGPAVADDAVQEVIVTATRRAQSVTDIPYNISAVGSADLQSSGVTDLQGLTHMVPGLVSPDLGARASSSNSALIIRGLNASSVNTQDQNIVAPLVSTYVDETPLFANLKMTDIERVEVLRGPQGTLYGSGSVGGTIRMIHTKPDFTATELDVSTRGSHTQNSGNLSGAADAILNIPLADNVAFRASGGYEHLGGFTDAVSQAVLGADRQPVLADPAEPLSSPGVFAKARGVDWSTTTYFRGALRWKANEALEVNASYQHQLEDSGGFSQVHPGSRYDQELYLPQPGTFRTDLGALDASLDVGFATVSSSSSYTRQTSSSSYDLTGLIESLSSYYGGYPRILSPIDLRTTDKAFTEEVRLVSKKSGPWDWVAGAYYSDRRQFMSQYEPLLGFASWAALPGSGSAPYGVPGAPPFATFDELITDYNGGIAPSANPAYPDLNFTMNRHVRFTDKALFSEVSYHLTDKWQVTGGARLFWQRYDEDLQQTLPWCGPLCSASGTDPSGLTAVTEGKGFHDHVLKFNTSYDIAPRTLLYATWSEGFRRGGVNALPTGGCVYCEPSSLLTYQPDKARNSEIGIKGSFGKGSSYTFTLYHIDWLKPQIEGFTVVGGFDFVANGEKARSQGIESELTLAVTSRAKVELGYSFTDAKLTESFVRGYDDLVGVAGDRLPGVSRQQGTVALDYTLPFGSQGAWHARIDASYRSDFWTALQHSALTQDLPGFLLLNTRLGYDTGPLRVEAFVENLTNQMAATTISPVPGPDHERALYVSRPRTVGIDLHYYFRKN
ncbi:MAG TPA: TonB-dependent receptor [Steroidobacteraceae bacterium]|nr:TonB-dependent receptor [Steroidobacteraceae bacterium]